jgi:anti-anti-sigma regulatory factor
VHKEHDVPATLEQDAELNLIRLEGAIDIGCAAELKRLLVQALDAGQPVRVSLEAATELDVTAVQLLWAAARQAKGAGVKFSLTGPASSASNDISGALGEAGLQQFLVPVEAG